MHSGEMLKSQRKALKHTQSFVASKIGVYEKQLGLWEKGSPIPSDKLFELSCLGYDINYIVTGTKASNTTPEETDHSIGLTDTQSSLLSTFIKKMKQEIVSNNNKGDMVSDWNANFYDLNAEITYHLAKLTKAMLEVERGGSTDARKEVDEFAADVANYMAKTCQTFGTMDASA